MKCNGRGSVTNQNQISIYSLDKVKQPMNFVSFVCRRNQWFMYWKISSHFFCYTNYIKTDKFESHKADWAFPCGAINVTKKNDHNENYVYSFVWRKWKSNKRTTGISLYIPIQTSIKISTPHSVTALTVCSGTQHFKMPCRTRCSQ